jgi:hypothetical protein
LKEPNSFTSDTVIVQQAFMVCFRTLHRQYQRNHVILTEDDGIKEQQGKRRSNQSARQRYVGEGPFLYKTMLIGVPTSCAIV